MSENSTPKYYSCRKRYLVAHVTDKPKDYCQVWLNPGALSNALTSAFLLWVPFLEVLSSLWQDDYKLFWSQFENHCCRAKLYFRFLLSLSFNIYDVKSANKWMCKWRPELSFWTKSSSVKVYYFGSNRNLLWLISHIFRVPSLFCQAHG